MRRAQQFPLSREFPLSRTAFPPDFAWGTATAAYQIEGAANLDGKGKSIWDVYTHEPMKIHNNENGDIACDSYQRYPDDIRLMEDLGLNSYRFSISWPRILPDGRGKVNNKGLDHYERLTDELLKVGIQPLVTLYHWDLPQVLFEEGGWVERSTAEAFCEYADAVSRRLGDRVKNWITINEPFSCIYSHLTGKMVPGEKGFGNAVYAGHHLLLAHGLCLPILRGNSKRPDTEVGISLSLNYYKPGNNTPEAKAAAGTFDAYANRWFLDPIYKGSYPCELVRAFEPYIGNYAEDMKIISQPTDFLGMNYYLRSQIVSIQDITNWEYTTRTPQPDEITDMGWEVYPEGLYLLLQRINSEYTPGKILITENGAAFKDEAVQENGVFAIHDPHRTAYIQKHILAVLTEYRINTLYCEFDSIKSHHQKSIFRGHILLDSLI